MQIVGTGHRENSSIKVECKQEKREVSVSVHMQGAKPSWVTLNPDEVAALIGALTHYLRMIER